jgi:hypothetical protein
LENPAAWIKHAAINRIRHQRRGQGRMGTEPSRLVDRDEMTATSDEGLDVLPALAGLRRQQRAVVALYYLLDQATSAIVDTLDITEATVRLHLGNARLQLVDPFADQRRRAAATLDAGRGYGDNELDQLDEGVRQELRAALEAVEVPLNAHWESLLSELRSERRRVVVASRVPSPLRSSSWC